MSAKELLGALIAVLAFLLGALAQVDSALGL